MVNVVVNVGHICAIMERLGAIDAWSAWVLIQSISPNLVAVGDTCSMTFSHPPDFCRI